MKSKYFILLTTFLLLLSLTGCFKGREPKYFVNVTVSVKDISTNKGIVGANVISDSGKSGVTDTSGTVLFSNMAGNKKYNFVVKVSDYTDSKFSLDVKTDSLTHTVLMSKHKGSISGLIVDSNDKPIEGGIISVANTSLSTYSQGDGSFKMIDIPVSKTAYTLDIQKDSFNPRKIYNIYITTEKPTSDVGKIILANDPGKLLGNVTDSDGQPLMDVTVFIKEANQSIKTNTQGSYTLELPPGLYTVTFNNQYYNSRCFKYMD